MKYPEYEQTIIVSNGRSGSTLLSDLIAEDSETLSAQEFLNPFMSNVGLPLPGAAYWEKLSAPFSATWSTAMRLGASPPEFRCGTSARWADDSLTRPHIMTILLPKLTPDPDDLFDQLADRVPHFPTQSLARHNEMLLNLLTTLLGKLRWVERSGGSTQYIGEAIQHFPNAKIAYLTRNVADTALSMSRHPLFQLLQIGLTFKARCGADPYEQPLDEVPADLVPWLPEHITLDALREQSGYIDRHVGLCRYLNAVADQALHDCPPHRLHRIRYEDLTSDPVPVLADLATFIGIADPTDWAVRVSPRVRTAGAGRTPSSNSPAVLSFASDS